jgi:hypothetical protein
LPPPPDEVDERRVLDEDRAHRGREDFPTMMRAMIANQDRTDEVVVEALEGGEQGAADAPGADDAHHRRIAQVRIELIRRESDEPREDLRQNAVRQHGEERSAGRRGPLPPA